MLSDVFLNDAADSAAEIYDDLADSIIRDIIRRLKKNGSEVTDTAAWQASILKQHGGLYEDAMREIAAAIGKSEQEIKRLFTAAVRENIAGTTIEAPSMELLASNDSGVMAVLNAGLKRTNGTLKNLTRTTALSAQQTYIKAASLAQMQIVSGAFDYNTAVYNATKLVLEEGICVLYPSGHRDQVDVAVRRAVLTGMNQTMCKVNEEIGDELDLDLVEVSAHSGARPSHAAWQGKIYSRSGKSKKYPYLVTATGYGTGAGLAGWNCRHHMFPYLEGTARSVDDDYVKALNSRKVKYNDKEYSFYDATQLQRKMERDMRKMRRELAALDELGNIAPAKDEFQRLSVKLKDMEARYADLSRKTGMVQQKARLRTVGFGKSVSQKAVWADREYYELFRSAFSLNGAGLPKSIDEYRKIKYNDTKEYNRIKKYTTVVNKGEVSPLLGYDIYRASAVAVENQLLGLVTGTGTEIKDYSAHFVARLIGQTGLEQERQKKGVALPDVKKALLSGRIKKTSVDSIALRGENCIVTVNPATGVLIQTNKHTKRIKQ